MTITSSNPITEPTKEETLSENNTLKVNALFVYGSLTNDNNFQLITGQILKAESAILYNHRLIQPRMGFPFAVQWRGSKIEGRLLYDVTPSIMVKLDEYEAVGKLFKRKIVKVKIQDEFKDAYVYIGRPKSLKPYFKKGFKERDRIDEFIEKSVEKYLNERADRHMVLDREALPFKVTRELLSEEVHGLMRQYFEDIGLPPFIIRHELEKASIPDLSWIKSDKKALKYADNYIALAVKFMIFNQLEDKFRNQYRYHVNVADTYYLHSISALLSLKLIVEQNEQVRIAMRHLGIDRFDPSFSYPDYAVAAIFIADQLFQKNLTDGLVEWVNENRHVSRSPLGAELEFSNLGVNAITAEEGADSVYDSFHYFYDFDLMRRGWKLGAHVDDHGFLTTTDIRTRGFLELAFGRYKLLGDVSKPATQDPWVLSQLIDLAVRFIEVKPHSLHLSIQTSQKQNFKKLENPEYYLCLLLLGGDLREDSHGKLREMRIFRGEILHPDIGVFISRLNRHQKNTQDKRWNFVVEYQFPRLSYDYDYQPLIMALKGFQSEANPYPFKNCNENPFKEYHEEMEAALLQWAAFPTPISKPTINKFLQIVEKGLDREAKTLDPEYARYSQRILGRIEEQLGRRNKRIKDYLTNAKKQPDQRY